MKIEERNGELTIVDFNGLEAYNIASKVEKDGIVFYENLAKCVKKKEVKDELQLLINEEKKHLKFFQDQISAIEESEEDSFQEDNLLNYMDYGIFQPYQGIKDMADKIDDVNKALRLGVLVEDKSIKFYQACLDKVSSLEAKKEIANIIEEEKRHKVLFESMLKEIVGGR